MEIRTLQIDFDKGILEVNGELIKNKPIIVTLPGPDGWRLRKLYNPQLATGNPKECDIIDVTYTEAKNKL